MSSSFLYASDVFGQQLRLHRTVAEMSKRSRSRRMSRSEILLLFLWKRCKDLKFSVRTLMILFYEFTFFVKNQSVWSGEVGENIWLSSLFFVGNPQKNWQPSFASNHTNNAHIPTSQLLTTCSLTSSRAKGFPLSAPHGF
jgi:hypothetical protein